MNDKKLNNSCYICLEDTDIHIKSNSCDCKIYAHIDCYDKYLVSKNSCIICKEKITNNKIDNINKTCYKKFTLFMDNFIENSLHCISYISSGLIGVYLLIILSFIVSFTIILHIMAFRYIKSKIILLNKNMNNKNYKIYKN